MVNNPSVKVVVAHMVCVIGVWLVVIRLRRIKRYRTGREAG